MAWADIVAIASSLIGFSIVVMRLTPYQRKSLSSELNQHANPHQSVSIVIPARNEEANLPTLLQSLSQLSNSSSREEAPDLEIILVDDESKDRTREIAEQFAKSHPSLRMQIVRGRPRPEGWTGKNWACHQGYRASTGNFLLFTDADTFHHSASIFHALERLRKEKLDLLSAVPYHRTEVFWEKLLGPFHLLVFISTAAFSAPQLGRIFAIGQYLLFTRSGYELQGGHERIKGSLCDDLELADNCLRRGGRYAVELKTRLYDVRMYASFSEFISGWRRIFRLGLKYSRPASVIEMYFVIACLAASFRFSDATWIEASGVLAATGFFAFSQRRYGSFSILGCLLAPFSVAVFIVISALAVFDLMLKRDLKWRGRSYGSKEDKSFETAR